jgi:TPR repeat protein
MLTWRDDYVRTAEIDTKNLELCAKAHGGDRYAQELMGKGYRWGEAGFEQNHTLAFMWYSLSAANGNFSARWVIEYNHGFTQSLLHLADEPEANRLLAEWKPNPKSCENEFGSNFVGSP